MILSVQKAMTILSVIANAKNKPVSLMEISRLTGFPKPTCVHILETLCHDGYTERISHSAGYQLGPALYCLTSNGRYEEEFVALCRPVMRWMERNSHATVILSVIQSGQKFIIDYADSEQKMFADHPQIRPDDIYRTATGRAILSHMDHDAVKEVYSKYGNPQPGHWDEVTSYESLCDALQQVRLQKIVFAESKIEGDVRMLGYACALFRRTVCVGAIGLGWRLLPENPENYGQVEENLKRVLLKGAKEIRRRLSYEE